MSQSGENGRRAAFRGNIEAYVLCALMILSVVFIILVPTQIPAPKISFGRALGQLEPTFFPRLAAAGLFATSAAALFVSIRMGGGNPFAGIGRKILLQLGGIIVILWLFALAFVPVGYLVSGIAVSLVLSLYLGNRNPITLAILCIGVPAAIYYIFTKFLLISLPEGILY
jgi:putative tricarboxylic transport membrane protein